MKVLLVNGSPHKAGCTHAALEEVAAVLRQEGVEPQFFWIGKEPLAGCMGCGVCKEKRRCVFDDKVNEFLALAQEADGFIFGSPVHFAAMSGAMTAFLDRVFYANRSAETDAFYLKPGAAVVSARRAGTTAALDQMNKYFLYAQMPVIPSRYWNMVHGQTPDEVRQDLEGMQIMRVLGRNMAWFLRCKAAGEQLGVALPEQESTRLNTNFIR